MTVVGTNEEWRNQPSRAIAKPCGTIHPSAMQLRSEARLSPEEAAELGRLEDLIRSHLQSSLAAGNALLAIRNGRLYRDTHSTFEDYCEARWGLGRQHVNRWIQWAEVVSSLGPCGPESDESGQAVFPLARTSSPTRTDRSQLVEAVYAATRDLERGDVLTYEEIRKVLNVDPHTGCWQVVVNKVRQRLEAERGISTYFVLNHGYELLSVEKQLELMRRRSRKAARQLRRGLGSLRCLPREDLNRGQIARLASLIAIGKRSLVSIHRDMRAQSRVLDSGFPRAAGA